MSPIFPWDDPASSWANDGPDNTIEFELHERRFRVTPTEHVALLSGRVRYKSECLSCNTVLHEGSTSGRHWIEQHLERGCNWKMKTKAEKAAGVRIALRTLRKRVRELEAALRPLAIAEAKQESWNVFVYLVRPIDVATARELLKMEPL